MDHVLLVAVLEGGSRLRRPSRHGEQPVEGDGRRLHRLEPLGEAPALCEVCDDHHALQRVIVDDLALAEPDDVWVVERAQQLELLDGGVQAARLEFCEVDELERVEAVFALSEEHLVAAAEELADRTVLGVRHPASVLARGLWLRFHRQKFLARFEKQRTGGMARSSAGLVWEGLQAATYGRRLLHFLWGAKQPALKRPGSAARTGLRPTDILPRDVARAAQSLSGYAPAPSSALCSTACSSSGARW